MSKGILITGEVQKKINSLKAHFNPLTNSKWTQNGDFTTSIAKLYAWQCFPKDRCILTILWGGISKTKTFLKIGVNLLLWSISLASVDLQAFCTLFQGYLVPLDALIKVGEANESLAINELMSTQYEVLIELSPTRRQELDSDSSQVKHRNSSKVIFQWYCNIHFSWSTDRSPLPWIVSGKMTRALSVPPRTLKIVKISWMENVFQNWLAKLWFVSVSFSHNDILQLYHLFKQTC